MSPVLGRRGRAARLHAGQPLGPCGVPRGSCQPAGGQLKAARAAHAQDRQLDWDRGRRTGFTHRPSCSLAVPAPQAQARFPSVPSSVPSPDSMRLGRLRGPGARPREDGRQGGEHQVPQGPGPAQGAQEAGGRGAGTLGQGLHTTGHGPSQTSSPGTQPRRPTACLYPGGSPGPEPAPSGQHSQQAGPVIPFYRGAKAEAQRGQVTAPSHTARSGRVTPESWPQDHRPQAGPITQEEAEAEERGPGSLLSWDLHPGPGRCRGWGDRSRTVLSHPGSRSPALSWGAPGPPTPPLLPHPQSGGASDLGCPELNVALVTVPGSDQEAAWGALGGGAPRGPYLQEFQREWHSSAQPCPGRPPGSWPSGLGPGGVHCDRGLPFLQDWA